MSTHRRSQEPRAAHVRITDQGGSYPTQVQGTIDGHPFFFWERAGDWSLAIVPPGQDPVGVWQADAVRCPVYWAERARWEEPRCDGYGDALRLIDQFASDFLAHGWTHLPPTAPQVPQVPQVPPTVGDPNAPPDTADAALPPTGSDTDERREGGPP